MNKTLELITWAKNNKKAICAFNFSTIDVAKAILEEAHKIDSPVILETSVNEAEFLNPKEAHSIVNVFRPSYNFSLHLDHGKNEDLIYQCIDAGYDSVHINLSITDIDEFTEKVRLLTVYCHNHNVTVEAGIDEIGGTSTLLNESTQKEKSTDPQKASYFALRTGIDYLLVSIGETHGMSEGDKLDFNLLSEIHKNVQLPLVLHGGSGIKDDDLRKAINLGICKINFNTELRIAWAKGIQEAFTNNPSEIVPYRILPVAHKKIQQVVKKKITICTIS
jgi:ketose-bisphosphate aldolase